MEENTAQNNVGHQIDSVMFAPPYSAESLAYLLYRLDVGEQQAMELALITYLSTRDTTPFVRFGHYPYTLYIDEANESESIRVAESGFPEFTPQQLDRVVALLAEELK